MRKIFTLFVAALFCASMFADKIYFKVTADWWKYDYENKTAVGAYAWTGEGESVVKLADWPGAIMTPVEGEKDIWVVDIDLTKYEKILFTRILPDGTYKGVKTADLTIPSDKDMYTILKETRDWDHDPEALAESDGEWSVFVPSEPAGNPIVAIAGEFNGWNPETNVMVEAADGNSASVMISMPYAKDYKFKVVLNGEKWVTKQAGNYDLKRDYFGVADVDYGGGNNDNFNLMADTKGNFIFTWTFANDSLGIEFPELPEVTLEDGYYLVGINGWYIRSIEPANKFAPFEDESRPNQYRLANVELAAGDQFKVVEVKDKNFTDGWYGTGAGNDNYVVTVAGKKDIYFVPVKQDDWNGYIWLGDATTAIDNTAVEAKAVKFFENGQLVIMKNGVKYNAVGNVVK